MTNKGLDEEDEENEEDEEDEENEEDEEDDNENCFECFASTQNYVTKMLIHLSRAGNSISEEEMSEKYVWCLFPL